MIRLGIITELTKLFPYIPVSILRFAVSIRAHRLALRVLFGSFTNIELHTPEGLPQVNAVMLQRELESLVPSSATGIFIVIDDVKLVEQNLPKWKNIDERWFNEYVEKILYPKMNNILYSNKSIDELNTFEKHVLEEYTHHLLMVNTSISMYIDACSWANRIYHMFLTEGIYNVTKIGRNINSIELKSLMNLGEKWIDEVMRDDLLLKSFRLALAHYCYVKCYGLALKPIVEGVTLALIERDPIKQAKEKFEDQPEVFSEVKFFIEKSQQILEKNNGKEDKQRLIESVNKTLNIPINNMEIIRSARGYIVNDFWNLIRTRFQNVINGIEIKEAKRSEKSFGMVINYITKPIPINNAVISMLLSKMKEVEGFQSYFSETLLRIEDRYRNKPAMFVRLPSLNHLRYDPWVHLDELDKFGIGDLSSFVGDLTPSHKIIIDMIFHKAGSSIIKEKFEENKYLKEYIIGITSYMKKDIQDEILDWLKVSAKWILSLEKRMNLIIDTGIPYEKLWDEEVFKLYLTVWLCLIKEAAKKGKEFFDNLWCLSYYYQGIS